MGFQTVLYQLDHLSLLSPQVSRLVLKPKDAKAALGFVAGQYIKVILPDGSGSPLSIAAPPSDTLEIELHLSHPAKNKKALEILDQAKAGMDLGISGPYGECTIARMIPNTRIIFYVRGTGFAPVKAILEELVQYPLLQPVHLFWGVATSADFYMQDLIKVWAQAFSDFRFTPIVSRTVDQHKLRDAVILDYPDLSTSQIYASGPPDMVYSALADFQQHGLQKAYFYSDVIDYESKPVA
jgi:CDP-4-dehydro-6-deoxyglucose reductase